MSSYIKLDRFQIEAVRFEQTHCLMPSRLSE